MMKRALVITVVAAAFMVAASQFLYGWFSPGAEWPDDHTIETVGDIPTPSGYVRAAYDSNSFAGWLRELRLRPQGTPVETHNGVRWHNQKRHYAVLEMNIDGDEVQQCADIIIRMRSEYLYQKGNYDSISFNFTSGDTVSFKRWSEGFRPVVRGNSVTWKETAKKGITENNFREYLSMIYMYSGTWSLSRQLERKTDLQSINPGDIFIDGGFPGHTVIVVDVAVDTTSGAKLMLLAQGFTPAQDIHVLVNPDTPGLKPWYKVDFGDTLKTPDWTFTKKQLREF